MNELAVGPKSNTYFIVKNITPDRRTIKIFGNKIIWNQELDLLGIRGIGEEDIRASLLKGELGSKLRSGIIEIIQSDINLLQFNEDQRNFLLSKGISVGNNDIYIIQNQTELYHAPIVTASFHNALPGTTPTPTALGALMVLSFSLDNDQVWRQFKIPEAFSSNPNFHIHWTKTSNVNEQNKNVKWELSYIVFESSSSLEENVNISPTIIYLEDTYLDSRTTDRIMYRTPNYSATGFVAGHYISLSLKAVTPTGTALTAPGLFSVDLTYNQFINQY